MSSTPALRPIRVALVNDYEIVVRGLETMLARFSDWVEIIELSAGTEPSHPLIDIALYDSFAAPIDNSEQIRKLVEDPDIGHVVVYTWNMAPDLITSAARAGVHGYLAKSMTGPELVDALVRVNRGDKVVSKSASREVTSSEAGRRGGDWAGRAQGLTLRESEVIALITQGLSNNEIAARGHLSINSVKSYIRSAYKKMGVVRRSQAVLWGVHHGFEPGRRTDSSTNGG